MKDQFLPYESCLTLKWLGFDEECLGLYVDEKLNYYEMEEEVGLHRNSDYDDSRFVAAPLYQQVKQWLWEKHQMHIKHEMVSDDCFEYYIRIKMSQLVKYSDSREYKSPVIAEREGIKAAIEYIYEKHKR